MLWRMSLTVIAVLLIAPAAFTQQPVNKSEASRFHGAYGTVQPSLFSLLSEFGVRKELGVTDKQESQILDILDQTPHEPSFSPALQHLSEKERLEKREATKKKIASSEDNLKKLLTQQQLTRLNQLEVQAWGVLVVTRPDIAKAVGLSEEQKLKIRQVRRPYPQAPNWRELQGMPLEQRQNAVDQWRAKVKEKEAEMLNVLSDEQKAKFFEFRGKDFAFPSPKADWGRRSAM